MRIIGLGATVTAVAALALWSNGERAGSARALQNPVGTVQGAAPVPRPATIPPTVIGMNLGHAVYYSTEWPFANLFKSNGDFKMGGITPPPVPLEPGGRPTNVLKNTELMITVDAGTFWRTGTYNCKVSPGWRVRVRFPGNGGTMQGDHDRFRLTIPKGTPGVPVHLMLVAEQDGVTLSTLSCVAPGQESMTFSPQYVAETKPFKVIRFLDWMHTNNHWPQTWANRPLPTDLSIAVRGASVEDMVELANTAGVDPWFTLPFDSDDDFYRRFAIYVRDHLAPDHKAYVELSNEVWNGAFQQSKDATTRGKARYPGLDDQKATDYYYADRVRDMMAIWSEVFAAQPKRLVRVASTQSAWHQRAEDILSHKQTWRSLDAIATAPYFGGAIQDIQESGQVRVDKVLARLPALAAASIQDAVAVKAIANKYGVSFMTYEGGPDVIGYTPEASADATAIVHDPRMYKIYTDYLENWRTRVGGLMVLYQGTTGSTYGHRGYTGQPLSETPKMRALLDFMARHPQ